jgi:hypothetical protein
MQGEVAVNQGESPMYRLYVGAQPSLALTQRDLESLNEVVHNILVGQVVERQEEQLELPMEKL